MEWIAAIAAFLGIVGLILKRLFEVKSKLQQALDLKEQAAEKVNEMRGHLVKGDYGKLEDELDRLSRNIDALRRMHPKDG